jgi:hypothetical protein
MNAQAFGKFCPVCKNRNDASALICTHCGASLEKTPTEPTTTRQVDGQTDVPSEIRSQFADDLVIPAEGIALFLPGSTTPIAVRTEKEFIVGRAVKGMPEPLVDLTEFDGYVMGVSRQHALIRSTGSEYVLIDLQSSNGTWLNGQRIVPDKPYPLPSGTAVYLGRLRLFVLYQPPSSTKKPE